MSYQPVFDSFTTRPKSQYFTNPYMLLSIIKDNFSLHTWLLMGALIQGLICLLPYRNIALISPGLLLLAYKLASTLLMTFGLIKHPYMEGVIPGRTAVIYPTEKGSQGKPCDRPLCAIMLAVRSNHPLGMFAPGYKEVGDYFKNMITLLDKEPTKWGFLGSSAWLSCSDRGVASEYMSMVYFETEEYLHAWAHGPLHTDAMEWWQRTQAEHKHIAIMHEVYATSKNNWEGVYINYHPTGLGQTTKEAMLDGKKVWINPLVRAKGRLNYSKGRMGRVYDYNSEWSAFEKTLSPEETQDVEPAVQGCISTYETETKPVFQFQK